jgi:tRNA 2-selenouridine synthase
LQARKAVQTVNKNRALERNKKYPIFASVIHKIEIADFFSSNKPFIDVRSPGEYAKGHIPGAVNIPLFSDTERAHIGTVYVQQSKEKATELGYKYVNPKLSEFIVQSKKVGPEGKVAVHCWRGGMRSRLFAEYLHNNGFKDVSVIVGGYKAYRNYLLRTFDIPFDLKIVGGYTGSGKTYVIKQLQSIGFQVIDLESLAKHKGSAFGELENVTQPTVEQFENNLFNAWRKLDYSQPIWLEDESHNIGGVNIPMNLFNQMRAATVFFLDIPLEERAKHLVIEYADSNPLLLAASIGRLSKRLGGLNTTRAIQFLHEKNFYGVALLMLGHYDKTYLKGMQFHLPGKVMLVPGNNTDPVANAQSIIQLYEQHQRNKTNPI